MNKILKRLYYFIIGIKEIFTNIFGISKLIKNNSFVFEFGSRPKDNNPCNVAEYPA